MFEEDNDAKIERLERELRKMADDLARLKEQHDEPGYYRQRMDRAKDMARERYDYVNRMARERGKQLDHMAHENPWTVAAIAATLGVVLAQMFHRRRY